MTCLRRGPRQLSVSTFATGLFIAAISSDAFAQEAEEPPPPTTVAPPPVMEAPTTTEAAPPQAAAPTPPEAAGPPPEAAQPAPVAQSYPPAALGPVADSAPAEAEPEPAAAEEDTPWYDNFSLAGFVDAYMALRSDKNNRPNFNGIPANGYYHEGYVQANGFALAVAGVDFAYTGEQFGATLSMRMGPAVNRFYAANMTDIGIENLTQAYVTYKPVEQLTLDLGQFGTLYGAEVLESWNNVNYSRGALYYSMQPFWHTGLRANLAFSDAFALNAMVVNGVNNAFENNRSPSVGLQALISAGDVFSLSLGYLGALNPTQGGNGLFQNFFDVVATVTAGGFKLVANADLNLYKPEAGADGQNWWGISFAPAYAFSDMFGIGARVEYLSDSANLWGMTTTKVAVDPEAEDNGAMLADKASLTTLTFTVDIKPIPDVTALVLRPEFRYEIAGNYYFFDKDNELTKSFWTVMLGAVVTSM